MVWPTPQDYNEAVQNPHLNFADAELRGGQLEVTPMGLPRVASGAFASVYRMQSSKRDVAVRCFLHNISDQHQRYEAISKFLWDDNLDCTVDFEYVDEGIRVQGAWYPILKMEWAHGRSLDEFVRAHLSDGAVLGKLAENFKTMLVEMRRDGIAHGDLQHGNLIVQNDGAIKLVDYDGMFVPALSGMPCNEVGHRNYQHPLRSPEHFGPYLDNFAAWSIYTSLFCLSCDPSLLEKVKGGDECLLFRLFDYRNPTKSRTFASLEEHEHKGVQELARKFRSFLSLSPDAVPYLDEEVEIPADLPKLQLHLRRSAGSLPMWMLSEEEDDAQEEIDFRETLGAGLNVVSASFDEVWPTVTSYTAAISAPAACFFDEDLQLSRPLRTDGRVQPTRHGQNLVFRLHRAARSFAVKVFLEPDEGRSQRYKDLAIFLRGERSYDSELHKFIPRVEYQEKGIRVGDRTYPIVKMEWIEGKSIENLVTEFVSDALIESTRFQFRTLMQTMAHCGMVHGELEPSNLIISPDGLRLIDFDAVKVPNGKAPPAVSSGKLAHRQEPEFVDSLSDLFPAWVIDSALTVLHEEPELRFSVPSNHFLFERADFDKDAKSEILQTMENSKRPIVHQRARLLKCLAEIDRWTVPPLRIDAGLDKSFARYHHLDFLELTTQLVSPDIEQARDPYLPLVRSPEESSGNGAVILVQGLGGFTLLVVTMYFYMVSAIALSCATFLLFLAWITFIRVRED